MSGAPSLDVNKLVDALTKEIAGITRRAVVAEQSVEQLMAINADLQQELADMRAPFNADVDPDAPKHDPDAPKHELAALSDDPEPAKPARKRANARTA